MQIGHTVRKFKNKDEGTPTAVQGYDCVSNTGGAGSVLVWGTKIPHAVGHGQKIKKIFRSKDSCFYYTRFRKRKLIYTLNFKTYKKNKFL